MRTRYIRVQAADGTHKMVGKPARPQRGKQDKFGNRSVVFPWAFECHCGEIGAAVDRQTCAGKMAQHAYDVNMLRMKKAAA